MFAALDEVYDAGHEFSISAFGVVEIDYACILLYAPHGPQQHVGGFHLVYLHRYGLACHEVVYGFLGGLHGADVLLGLVGGQCEAGERDECVACTGFEPWISCQDVVLAVLLVVELVGGIDQTVFEVVARGVHVDFLFEGVLQCARTYFFKSGSKDHTFTFLYIKFEVAGHVEVFAVVVSQFLVFRVFYAFVPRWCEDELGMLVGLHVEVGVALIHRCLDSVVHFLVVAAGHRVLMCQFVGGTECEEWPQTQRGHRVCVKQCVAYEHTVVEVLEHFFFLQYHSAHAVYGGWNLVPRTLAYVFMAVRAEHSASISVQSEVEFRSVLYDCLVERRQEHMIFVVDFGHWHHEQAVILACVAIHNRRR